MSKRIDFSIPSNTRESILLRPKRQVHYFNRENIDVEYEREQARLAAKRKKREQQENLLRKTLWGNPIEKKELQEMRRKEIDRHLEIRRSLMQQEAMRDLQSTNHSYKQQMQYENEIQRQNQEKRAYLQSLMEENKRLVEYRNALKREMREKELELGRKQVEFIDHRLRSVI